MALTFQLILLLGLSSGLWMGIDADCKSDCCVRCPEGWSRNYSRCYKFFKGPKDWSDAEDTCIDMGGNLAPIRDNEVDGFRDFVRNVTGGPERCWFGAYQMNEGNWKFANGEPFAFTKWGKNEGKIGNKKENCLEMMHRNADGDKQPFNDAPCHFKKAFICARDPIPA